MGTLPVLRVARLDTIVHMETVRIFFHFLFAGIEEGIIRNLVRRFIGIISPCACKARTD